MAFQYGPEIQEPDTARKLEFLMTAGHAYSSSTVSGNTRKYHGLFVHNGRLLLAGLDELINGIRISTQQYEGASDNTGLSYLHAFSVYPPRWVYKVGDVTIQKTVTFNGVLKVKYEITGDADLWIRPLITDRSVHEVLRAPNPACTQERNGVRWGDLLFEGDLTYESHPDTYWNIWYQQEHERGYESVENLHSPGVFQGRVKDSSVTFRCTRKGHDPSLNKHRKLSPRSPLDWLDWASDAFLQGNEIFAGYHWFSESWSRDTAISIIGLLIERDRKAAAQKVLQRLASGMKNGIIPNRFPDNYHTSDASLWFIHALMRYRRRWGDDTFIEEMKPVIGTILKEYPSSPVATLDHDLISVVPKSTWMDTEFTPREGKPVEINALWVNALIEADAMGIETPISPESAFMAFQRFWNEDCQCLYDRIDPLDSTVRPNQVVAIALGLVDQDQATDALNTVNKNLLTPYGLRTLSPLDPHYHGRYYGDHSYHNGCIWPWLTGWYVDALIRNGVNRDMIKPMLTPILHHLREAGVGYISEIFDGDPPHLPRGCIAQAWSVAEINRACRMVIH